MLVLVLQELQASRAVCELLVVKGIDILKVSIERVEERYPRGESALIHSFGNGRELGKELTSCICLPIRRCFGLLGSDFDKLLQPLVVNVRGRPFRHLVPGQTAAELHGGSSR